MANAHSGERTVDLAPADRYLNLWQGGDRPNLQTFLADAAPLSNEHLVAVICVDQRERWHRGERPPIETYLALDAVRSAPRDVPLDLILSEVLLREDFKDRPNLPEYVARFPEYEESLVRLFELNSALHCETVRTPSTLPEQFVPAPDDAPPAQVGKYRIVQTLGQGGQGVVYRAVHPTLGKDVIIKWSRRSVSSSDSSVDRLHDEGRILAELDHPNLARVYDLDVDNGHVYLVMEYIRGKTLDQWAKEKEPGPRKAAEVIAHIARALAVAHERGVLHLDLKPQNILIDETGRPRVIDFGLAQLRDSFSDDFRPSGGTIIYMAPEQAAVEPAKLSARTDVFNLGGVLFYLLTGKAPYSGAGAGEAMARAQKGSWNQNLLDEAKAPTALKRICRQALEPDPARRYSNAAAMADDLERYLRAPRRRAVIAGAACAFLCSALLIWGAVNRRAGPSTPHDKNTELAASSAKVPMQLRVWREKMFVDLTEAAPLKTGDEVQLHSVIPKDLHAALFSVDGSGKLQHLASRSPGETRFTFPVAEGKTVELKDPPGTEVLFLVARRSQPISVAEVVSRWGNQEPYPPLPGQIVLRINGDTITREGTSRGFGETKDRNDPEMIVRERLRESAQRFVGHFEILAGLVFAHEEALK